MAEKTIATTAKKWAREYETIYILRPNVEPEDAKKVSDRVQEVFTSMNARLVKVETWGIRRLAYTIARHTRGIFVYVRFAAHGDVIAELERHLRLLDTVIRYQTIIVNEKVDLELVESDAEDTEFETIEKVEDEIPLTTAQQLGMEARPSKVEETDEKAEDGEKSEKTEDGEKSEKTEEEVTKAAAADESAGDSSDTKSEEE